MNSQSKPSKRVALVTGCGKDRGMGSAIARELARDGKLVVATDVDVLGAPNLNQQPSDMSGSWRGLDGLVEELSELSPGSSSVVGDISQEADVQRMIATVLDRYGRLDILVNNACAPQALEYGPIQGVPTAAMDRVFDVNLRGTFFMCREAVTPMRAEGWGRIINISSIAARIGMARQAAYSASKAGILGLTRSLAQELAREGITVNAVCPGAILTSRRYSSVRRDSNNPSDLESDMARIQDETIPVGQYGTGEDIANAVMFFAAESSWFVTGQALNVDGGAVMT
jgi:3-oxoacyl-[acyl-carrier protein] reductase